jgi:hypothetical protein
MALVSGAVAQQVDRNKKVLDDRDRIEASGFWIYNSLERGVAEAKNQKKPLLVVFRCVPCEHCAQLDESLVSRDPSVQKLLEQFVCVRIVKANGMDLSLFQFDYDQSWTAFMMNPDLTIYGRYGTRSHRTESANDMSLVGFGKALEGALALHRGYPANRALFAAKRGSEPKFKSPEEFPWLKGRYTQNLDFGPKVAQSCIHCHQVGEGMRTQYRSAGLPIPEEVLFPYPNPRVVGLVMDPQSRATVKEVRPNTPAAAAGFQPGDEIDTVSAQPMLSTADIQWTLQHAGPTATLRCEARRAGKKLPLTLNLTSGWRRNDDISWRATSWDLRRMTTGGMVLEDASPEQRKQAGLAENTLALNVKSVGQYGAHAAAKNAGFRPADLIVGVDGHTEAMTESGWMAFLVNAHRPGEEVTVRLLRNGEKLQLRLPMQ